ncbi:helix-turn-helix transcriptional regulator [Microbulbifer sp. OS29]|uniref:Helix-turn-helix transcriptional regulator n=1 Tax=Microbulbifer okhotskensis TaxID=2926617 RepID=A0A9X2EQ88_9GAMM|nr:helix-turn-helix domain-containing protein [Microbulbifer okhotskensis]MCO1335345.1 helix-turn-helix transcriptional regulator [Microbulbifer okhotskensis]
MNFSSLSGPRIAAERKRLKLSQAEAAEECGVSREMWGKYERGKAAMGTEVLSSFVSVGADPLFILTGQTHSLAPEIAPDEQLLLDSYRELSPQQRKALLAQLLSGNSDIAKPETSSDRRVTIKGEGNRVSAQGDYYENGKKEE